MDNTERVKNIVEKDSFGAIESVMNVVQSDVAALFGEFMSVKDLSVEVKSDGNGGYVVTVQASADRIYRIGDTAETE